MNQAQQANKQIVELKWNPGPIVAVDHGDGFTIGPKVPAPTHTICAIGHESTTYFSAVFDTSGSRVNPAWDNAFNNFLKKNYGAEGLATCTSMATVREATRLLHDRVVGLRANNHKAVETGWKFDPTDIAANKPRPKPTPHPTTIRTSRAATSSCTDGVTITVDQRFRGEGRPTGFRLLPKRSDVEQDI